MGEKYLKQIPSSQFPLALTNKKEGAHNGNNNFQIFKKCNTVFPVVSAFEQFPVLNTYLVSAVKIKFIR